jgi:hypothetical protein
MNTLLIRHVESGDPPKFQAICPQDSRSSETTAIPSPVGYPVEGRPNSDLMRELRWYLEDFLDYPFSPVTEHAERVLHALRRWGMEAFNSLFGDRRGGEIFNDATREGYESLHLLISSDDPQVLGWPWEAIHDPQAGQLAQTCQIERRLNTTRKPDEIDRRWPKDQVNILLVTARPNEGDVRYRSISRPLVELIDKEDLPAQVTVLRPPTFENLREHLRERPDHYHIVHFDGHGSYGVKPAPFGSPHILRGPEGHLIFEDDQGKPDPITAEQLSVLLREHHMPAVVLNACQSAMVDEGAKDPFASVAAALLKSGVRSVVAMAYSLYVSGAQEFTTNWGGSPRSVATSRRRSSGTARRWRSRRSRGTRTARRAAITNWGGSPRSVATSRRRSSGTASRWRSGWGMVINRMRRSYCPILRCCGRQPSQDRSRNLGKRNLLLLHEVSWGRFSERFEGNSHDR